MSSGFSKPRGSFRVPNSLMHRLYSVMDCPSGKKDDAPLSSFLIVFLLGLMAKLDPNHPEHEVETTVAALLRIIEVGQIIEKSVKREWETQAGELKHNEYESTRFSPDHRRKIYESFLKLHDLKLLLRTTGDQRNRIKECNIHLLDSYGFIHRLDGKPTRDVDNLPSNFEKVKVGNQRSNLSRVRRKNSTHQRFEPICGVFYRLNTELVHELNSKMNTIGFTCLSRKVFELLRQHMKSPTKVRLILFVLRQRNDTTNRRLSDLMGDLGFDLNHPTRAITQFENALKALQERNLIKGFLIKPEDDRVEIRHNHDWYKSDEE